VSKDTVEPEEDLDSEKMDEIAERRQEPPVDEQTVFLRDHFRVRAGELAVDQFEVGNTLGTGTFGRVRVVSYSIGDVKRILALKMLKKREIIRLKQVEHIKSEKEILSMISHPFIVNFYGTFQDSKRVYMIMEYVIGGELFSQLRQAGRFTNAASRFYAAEIVLALQYLHQRVCSVVGRCCPDWK
jgi:serine/threonine protein kinase